MMQQTTFVDIHGKKRHMGVGAEEMTRYDLNYLSPVRTPHGRGVVVGLVGDMVYVRNGDATEDGAGSIVAYAVSKLGSDVTPLANVATPAPAVPTTRETTKPSTTASCTTEQRHRLKRVVVCGQALRVVMQDKCGPCPVLALANVLALQGKITLGFDDDSFITSRELRATIANYLWSTPPLPSFAQDGQPDTLRGEVGAPHQLRVLEPANVDTTEARHRGRATDEANAAAESDNSTRCELHSTPSNRSFGSDARGGADNKACCGGGTTSGPTLRDVVHDIALLEKARAELIGGSAADNLAERTLSHLYDGMDVDPIFTHPEAFVADRWTPLFALGGVRLLHGWVIEPDGPFAALRHLSFNELAMAVASSPLAPPQRGPTAEDEAAPSHFLLAGDEVADGESTRRGAGVESTNTDSRQSTRGEQLGTRHELARRFYNATYASQMTSHGLRQLHRMLTEGEFAVLFWRNHFFTLTKLKHRLLLLCSNESFADKPSFVFSVLRDASVEDGFTDGDGVEVDAVLSFVQAMTGNRFSEDQIHAAYAALVQRKAHELQAATSVVTVSPEEVLEYLRAAPAKAPQNHAAASDKVASLVTTSSNKSEAANALESKDATSTPLLLMDTPAQSEVMHVTELVHKFVEAFPGLTEVRARDYLARHNNDLAAAADAYCLEHLS